jgi:hypothetical protein
MLGMKAIKNWRRKEYPERRKEREEEEEEEKEKKRRKDRKEKKKAMPPIADAISQSIFFGLS